VRALWIFLRGCWEVVDGVGLDVFSNFDVGSDVVKFR
jgi:hypothetical protein